jgi:hypothetical protein
MTCLWLLVAANKRMTRINLHTASVTIIHITLILATTDDQFTKAKLTEKHWADSFYSFCMMVCKDTCIKYRARKPQPTLSRYDAGQKRCQVCAIFIEWKGVQCP